MRGLAALFLSIILAASLLATPFKSTAAVSVPLKSLDFEAVLKDSGTVEIAQTLELVTPSGLSWTLFSNADNLTVSADHQLLEPKLVRARGSSRERTIEVTGKRASIWVIRYQTTSTLIRHDDRDQFFYKIFEQPGSVINTVTARLKLNGDVETGQLSANVYAIGGVIDPRVESIGANVVVFSAKAVGPKALMTLNASWPKSVLGLSPVEELRLSLSNLDSLPWLALGLSLPLVAGIVLLSLLSRLRRAERSRVKENISQLPSKLSPMLVGVLVNKKIYPEEIVALLIDLCQRGYLVIVKKKGEYFLGKRREPDQYLEAWEADILSQLIRDSGRVISDKDVKLISKQSLFSPEVRRAFGQIYEIITKKHFFDENPHLTRVKFKLLALAFYFIGTIGMIWVAFSGASAYLLIPLIGTVAMSWLILRLSPQLIRYSPLGDQERRRWEAFGNYLALAEPLEPQQSRSQLFERHLAYAVALNKTLPWAGRFDRSSSAVISPEWFVSYQELTASELAQEMVVFTKKVSTILANMRGPLVN